MSSDPALNHQPPVRADVIRTMLADEYQRVLETLPPRYPGNRHSGPQFLRAKEIAKRNVLDRLQDSDGRAS